MMRHTVTILSCICFLFAFSQPSSGQTGSGIADPPYDDSVILALRMQSGIRLDTALEARIRPALKSARAVLDTLKGISAFPAYHPGQMIIETGEAWADAWRNGVLATGYPPVDSMNQLYGAVSVKAPSPGFGWFVLSFRSPLEMEALAKEYGSIPGIRSASPNHTSGDGDDITALAKNGEWYFIFSRGWGDCPSGCIHHSYWYVRVDPSGNATLEGEAPDAGKALIVHRWNVPARYAATVFRSVGTILDSTRSTDWWVRRHAVTVLGRLYLHDRPWSEEDMTHLQLFNDLRMQALDSRGAVDQRLRAMVSDPDPLVRQAVREAGAGLPASSIGHRQYYPLEMGNTWRFTTGGGSFTERIVSVDYCIPTGYLFDTLRGIPNATLSFLNDDSLLIGVCGVSTLLLNFAARPGESWDVVLPPGGAGYKWTVTLESTADTVKVPAGTFTDVYRFYYKFEGTDNDWVEYYAPGIGPIKRTLFGVGVIEYQLASHTKVGVVDASQCSCFLELLPHYPQPASTGITFGFISRGQSRIVEVQVFDALGRCIAVPFKASVDEGTHFVPFATGDLASGTYSYRIQTGTSVISEPFIVLR